MDAPMPVWAGVKALRPLSKGKSTTGNKESEGRPGLYRKLLEQDGYECGEVLHDSVMGHLKDGGMDISIDGYDGLCTSHAGDMLEGSGDSAGDVKPRGYGLTGGADLVLVFEPPQIACRARCSYG